MGARMPILGHMGTVSCPLIQRVLLVYSQPVGFVVSSECRSVVSRYRLMRLRSRSMSFRRICAKSPSCVGTPLAKECCLVRRPAGLCQITSLLCWHSSRSKVLLMRIRSPLAFRRNSFGFCRSHNALHYPATLPSASNHVRSRVARWNVARLAA